MFFYPSYRQQRTVIAVSASVFIFSVLVSTAFSSPHKSMAKGLTYYLTIQKFPVVQNISPKTGSITIDSYEIIPSVDTFFTGDTLRLVNHVFGISNQPRNGIFTCSDSLRFSLFFSEGSPTVELFSGRSRLNPEAFSSICSIEEPDTVEFIFTDIQDTSKCSIIVALTLNMETIFDTTRIFHLKPRTTGVLSNPHQVVSSGNTVKSNISSESGSGCGTGYGLAIIPLVYLKKKGFLLRDKNRS